MTAATYIARALCLLVITCVTIGVVRVIAAGTRRDRQPKRAARPAPFTQAELDASKRRVDEVMALEELWRLPAHTADHTRRRNPHGGAA